MAMAIQKLRALHEFAQTMFGMSLGYRILQVLWTFKTTRPFNDHKGITAMMVMVFSELAL